MRQKSFFGFALAALVAVVMAPVLLVAQDTPAVSSDVPTLLTGLLAVFAPSLAAFLSVQVLKLNSVIQGLPDAVKIALAMIVSFVMTAISAAVNIELPLALEGFDALTVTGLVNTAGSMAIFRLWRLISPTT